MVALFSIETWFGIMRNLVPRTQIPVEFQECQKRLLQLRLESAGRVDEVAKHWRKLSCFPDCKNRPAGITGSVLALPQVRRKVRAVYERVVEILRVTHCQRKRME